MAMHEKSFIHLTSHQHQQSWKTEVIAETDSWICLNKQTHLGTEYDHHHQERPHMTAIIEHDLQRQAGWVRDRGINWLQPVNVLDFETTGVSLWARNEQSLQKLKDQLHAEKPNRIYHALCMGTPESASFSVDLLLAPHRFQPWLMKSSKQGKKSLTHFETLETFGKHTLLKATPLTERYHQIRCHLYCKQHPVVADALYGGDILMLSELKRHYRFKKNRPERPLLDRAAIHLAELHIEDPDTGQEHCLEAAAQRDWQVAMKYLREFARPV
ncbi:MAG: hypothetical protein EBU26_02775 [Verrucomicrobia bacterium]|jgi:23S rRNA-/tRNA-specific pseudouridylate synthase|nr:hypothetical protein [Verrucomicrobiota bacterium]